MLRHGVRYRHDDHRRIASGHENRPRIGLAADISPQVSFGADVISRIDYSSKATDICTNQKAIVDAV